MFGAGSLLGLVVNLPLPLLLLSAIKHIVVVIIIIIIMFAQW
jgi:hypothetical protein